MRTKIKIDDLFFVMELVHGEYIEKQMVEKILKSGDMLKLKFGDLPSFKYQNLKDQIETYRLSGTPFDIKIYPIDEFLVDAYKTSCFMEKLLGLDIDTDISPEDEAGINEYMKDMGLPPTKETFSESAKKLKEDYIKFKRIFGNIMLHYEFTETEIRGIQRNYLNDMLKESIENEDYEESALVRDRINTF